tara:strand:+ start:75 stop:362 length:288 start_codon:yes stop_codon:yes gene_type:complete
MDKGEEQDNPTLFEIMKEDPDITYNEATEMKDAKERIKELENSLSIALEINENHQRYNGKLQTRVTDLEEDNKKLTQQINDYIKSREHTIRKAGL